MEKIQVFDVEVSDIGQAVVDEHLMINEDYYLPDEEILEYYTASAFVWMYDSYAELIGLHIINENDSDSDKTVQIYLDESPVGIIRKDQKAELIRLIRKGKIVRIEPMIGGGPYKQVKKGKVVSSEIHPYVKLKIVYDTLLKTDNEQNVFIYESQLNGGLG